MSFFTQDQTVIIQFQQDDIIIIYYNILTEESWIIYGKCSRNGSCIDGAINSDNRPYSERMDCPVRPEIECEGCNLRGEYL